MITQGKPLRSMTAQDLMSHEVITIPEDMNLRAAAALLARQQISGLPVVNAEGRCVGIVSTTDFLDIALEDSSKASEPVKAHMTADPVMVTPDTPIVQLAQMMINAHIHRVIVVDPDKRPIGVVSTTDVLAALHVNPS